MIPLEKIRQIFLSNQIQFIIFILYKFYQEMMFCGICTRDDEQKNQIVIYNNQESIDKGVRVSRVQRKQIMSLMESIGKSMIRGSQFKSYLDACIVNKKNFKDPQFPPNQNSLGYSHPHRRIVWKRIPQIVKDPVMVEDKIQPADIQQGNVGDCYFLAAVSSIAQVPNRIQKIFFNQMQVREEGIYRFAVACQGELTQIFIDDYIPVFQGSNRPVFCKSNKNQIWVMLLQKVWAKLSGSYGLTSQGYPHQVLNTLLVAPCFYTEIPASILGSQRQKNKLWEKLLEGEKQNYAMCAGSRPSHVCKGIKPGHTYSLLGCYEVTQNNMHFKILKLRNPWGDTQYTGKFSEQDKKFWDGVNPTLKNAIYGGKIEDNGVFTIELSQFIRNFESLDISHDKSANSKLNYGYTFHKVEAISGGEVYFDISIDQADHQPFYITMQKCFKRSEFVQSRQVQYGYSKLLLARRQRREDERQDYIYIDSKLETNFPDLTIKCEFLKPGNYIIMAETEFPHQNYGEFTLSIYSPTINDIRKIQKPDPLFIHKVFTHHAFNINQNREYILNSRDDWTSSMFLFEGGGFGYLLAHLGEDSHRKMKMLCDVKKVYENGFLLLQRGIKVPQGSIQIQIEKNDQCIIVFGVNFHSKTESLIFPPVGVKIVRIT